MHAFSDPPGQPLGLGDGAGVGVGDGEGEGEGPSVVLPRGPHLMSENITLELPCSFSTSSGAPDVVAHEPRTAPGSELSTGYVESNQSMLA